MTLKPQGSPPNKAKGYLSQRSPTRGTGSLLQTAFTLNRLHEMWHTHQGRKHAEFQALENQRLIDEGQVSGKLESSSLGTLDDAIRLGMLKSNAGGVYLGELEGHSIFLPSDFHVTCVGMAGSGKTSSIAIPNVISLGLGDRPESCFVFDLKDAEIYKATAKGREVLDGITSILIDPFNVIGGGVKINFLSDIIELAVQESLLIDKCRAKVRFMFSDPDKKGNNAWITVDAINLNIFVMAHFASYA